MDYVCSLVTKYGFYGKVLNIVRTITIDPDVLLRALIYWRNKAAGCLHTGHLKRIANVSP